MKLPAKMVTIAAWVHDKIFRKIDTRMYCIKKHIGETTHCFNYNDVKVLRKIYIIISLNCVSFFT